MAISCETFRKLSEHVGVFLHSTNAGIINAGGGIYLIDSGSCAEDGRALLRSAGEFFPGRKILGILCTHAHTDHCGGSAHIKASTGCTVWAPEYDSHIMECPGIMGDMYWGGKSFADIRALSFENAEPVRADISYSSEINLGEVVLEPVPLPGHFYGQTGILARERDSDTRTFFMADAFFGASMIKRYWIPFMQDPQKFRESVERITCSRADFYVPSHGDIYTCENINAIAELNVMITREMEFIIIKLLREKPRTVDELLKEIADFAGIELGLSQYVLIGYTLRSYLSCMHDAGRIVFTLSGNIMRWHAKE